MRSRARRVPSVHTPPRAGARPTTTPLRATTLVAAAALAFALAGLGALAPMVPSTSAATSTDPDRDGLPTTFEKAYSHTNPSRADTDADGIPDGREDLDRDGLTNRQEYVAKTHPRRADTDGDGAPDAREDPDHDGLPNNVEFAAGTHPLRVDTDRDGTPDGREDPDRDGLTNRQEYLHHTNPRVADTDGDGWTDGSEVAAGSDPRNAASVPVVGDAPTLPGAPGCPIFPASNVWNRPIDDLPVAGNSATLVGSIGASSKLHPDFGENLDYGIPYNIVSAATPRVAVTFDYADESDAGPYPVPSPPLIEAGSDAHVLLVDKDACRLWELYAASPNGNGGWKAGSGATWDLRSNALRPAGWTSADAAGLPILPGLVRYDEVAAGEIRHAIRFTAPDTRSAYVYPARHFASSDSGSRLPPMGLRVRLKATYDISGLPPQAKVIATAMQRYGMILADNGSSWYFQGMSDSAWDDEQLNALKAIPGSAFEVVDTTGFVNGP